MAAADSGKRSYLDDALDVYFDSVYGNAENKFELAHWSAWGNGAIVIEGGIATIPGFDMFPVSLDRAKSLVSLFIQPMVSIWLHNWESQEEHSKQDKDLARRIAFENIHGFLGINSQKSIDLCIALDLELKRFLEKEVAVSIYYVGMFHQRYRECINGTRIVKWERVQSPIASWQEFLTCCDETQYEHLDPESSLATFSLIAAAGSRMFKEFTRLYKE